MRVVRVVRVCGEQFRGKGLECEDGDRLCVRGGGVEGVTR